MVSLLALVIGAGASGPAPSSHASERQLIISSARHLPELLSRFDLRLLHQVGAGPIQIWVVNAPARPTSLRLQSHRWWFTLPLSAFPTCFDQARTNSLNSTGPLDGLRRKEI